MFSTQAHIKLWLRFTEVELCNLRSGRAMAQLRHCASGLKAAGSISEGDTGILHWHNPSGRTMAMGSTQPLAEMSTRNTSWGEKTAVAYRWQSYHLHVSTALKSGSLNLMQPSGPVQICTGIAFLYWLLSMPWGFRFKSLYVLPIDFTCVFCIDFGTNGDYFPVQH